MEATVDKCLAFCQALVSSNQKFTFTLSIGKETFKFNNQELVASSCVKSKKKKSPCQLRREDRRREARKLKIAEQVVEVPHSATPQQAAEKTAVTAVAKQESTTLAFKCELCDYKCTSESRLKQHTENSIKHRALASQFVADNEKAEESTPSPPASRSACPSPSRLSSPPPSPHCRRWPAASAQDMVQHEKHFGSKA